ncbi:hypothetical protein [Lactobacillus helveticus]|uniref:Uncharacterized protein n=1 Tax=Lactobacillus helveticus TaxID=1587 RepID=A0A6A7K2R1_LACHE|nr:hypothetical protein [Lactobacillus helveticus]MPW14736.1 hypothetical protein [Lactobacillus helveticus]
MDYTYHYINVPSSECKIYFFGEKNCKSNDFYRARKELNSFVLFYIKTGKGTHSLPIIQPMFYQKETYFFYPEVLLISVKLIPKIHGHIIG